jgi:hypothetical protein
MRLWLKRLSHLCLSAGFSTWRPLPGRLLWFRRACPSTTLDELLYYSIVLKNKGGGGICQRKCCLRHPLTCLSTEGFHHSQPPAVQLRVNRNGTLLILVEDHVDPVLVPAKLEAEVVLIGHQGHRP